MSMKTAEEWRKHFKVWAEEWASDKEIKTIQLDAFKAGAEWAAKSIEGAPLFSEYILTKVSNLKEIPK